MPHVVIQSCCSDGSCTLACPVNCIHPAPGEPGFAEAEMLYVDAATCVDCGACTTACPADAIVPHTTLTVEQQPFLSLNAEYFDVFPHADRTPLALVPPQRRLEADGPFRVAIVGAGPAGLYAADELLKHPEITVDVYDRLPTPYGLVRFGVAPDHQHTKQVQKLFKKIERQPGFRYFLNVEVGSAVSHEELASHYHAVLYTVGAAADRPLGVPGDDLRGSLSATDFVAWYNGHPDKQDLAVDLSCERVVVVGNGNVALDVARVLTEDVEVLETTDIAALPLDQLRRSTVREVVVLGRRGPAEAAFTVPELVGLHGLESLNVVVDAGGIEILGTDTKSTLLRDFLDRPFDPAKRTIVLKFLSSPVEVTGTDRVTGVVVGRNRLDLDANGNIVAVPTGETETIEAGLLLRAVGYKGLPVAGLPYEERTGTVPNEKGRVTPGVYVSGWVKRGPNGFIGTNKTDSEETVDTILDDLDAGLVPQPAGNAATVAASVRRHQPDYVDLAGWQAIEREERRRGAAEGRVRVKIVDVDEALRIVRDDKRAPIVAATRLVRNPRKFVRGAMAGGVGVATIARDAVTTVGSAVAPTRD
ncbi:FAD-dependent oxidoreductase [Nocardioides sp. Kera G14]|uniref:FAD-dependent oxidoreductase n=1 Tax=Nocardioides sp. Kera G14 TaxID=2884264 RepID=UPI001D1074FE|nr:FAD-dependent oxidoreductase [Nocardioides sp. Kera G14]UDY22190.1 FAD-dependent oxidoreductase [Nocardioides sp. Kera G14]